MYKLIQNFLGHKADETFNDNYCHVLDVYRKSLIPRVPKPKHTSCNEDPEAHEMIIRSATELHEAGIWFRKSSSESLTDVSFCCCTLRLPPLVVDDITETVLLNIIAFERFHAAIAGSEITSYVSLMDNIIDNGRDVALLSSKGIIKNAIGSDDAVADMFNSLSKDTAVDPKSDVGRVQARVNRFYQKKVHKWQQSLFENFRSPWTCCAFFAAIFLFVLTIVQTVISAMQLMQDSNKSPPPPPPPYH